MSWLGYVVLAVLAVFAANTLWVLLGSRQLRGRSVGDLTTIYPELAEHRGKAAIYCYSADCGPCRRITPTIDVLRAEHPKLLKLNIAERGAEARRLGIQATPTILLIEDGKILKALVGAHGLGALKVFLGAA
jgi:thiol-disulfide isomerase/thioredoxin